jgi:hypothetical protein
MFNNSQSFNPKDHEAILGISQLIIQLKDKKREWKSFKPKYLNYNRRAIFTAESLLLEDRAFLRKFGHVMKRIKKMNIKICSEYIFLLEKAIVYIRKQPVKRDAQLHIILQTLNGLYQKAIKSEIVSDLSQIHKMEFEDALRVKKHSKEFYQKVQSWDADWLRHRGYEMANFEDSSSIKRLQSDFAPVGSYNNWRKDTLVKNELRKVLQFKVFLENIIKNYENIVHF